LAYDPRRPSWRALALFIDLEARDKPEPDTAAAVYGRVLAEFDALLDDAPDDAQVLYYRARAFKRAGKLDRALADFQRVTTLDPYNRHARDEVRRAQPSTPPKRRGWLRER
jgi:tetratricopeptide (TPR) repeat protein